jgi:hypothetical protein
MIAFSYVFCTSNPNLSLIRGNVLQKLFYCGSKKWLKRNFSVSVIKYAIGSHYEKFNIVHVVGYVLEVLMRITLPSNFRKRWCTPLLVSLHL